MRANSKKIDVVNNLFCLLKKETKEFGVSVAAGRLLTRLPIGNRKKQQLYMKCIQHFVNKEYSKEIKETIKKHKTSKEKQAEKKIWVIWWQGECNMPELVKMCYNQLKKVRGEYEVVLITKDNYFDYIQLPEYIIEKANKGIISLTHLSDIIRCRLLLDYGGLYIDATVYASEIFNFQNKYFSPHNSKGNPYFVSGERWAIWMMHEPKNNSLIMETLYMCLCHHWRKYNEIVEYLLLDYIFELLYELSDSVKKQINSLNETSGCYELGKRINEPFSKIIFDNIMSSCAWQKLSYKQKLFPVTNSGEITFYGFLTDYLSNKKEK